MAHFVAIVDPDPIRRATYVKNAVASLGIVPELRTNQCDVGTFSAAWAAAEHAPISTATDDTSATVLWGEAIRPDGSRAGASDVRSNSSQTWDGFFAAVSFSRDGVVATADLLGLFPVYYWASGDVLLLASSIASFRTHPRFRATFNPLGAAGILLTGGLLDGQTLWRDARRLSPGKLLMWSADRGVREVRHYAMPMQETLANQSFDAHVRAMDEAIDAAIVRHVPAGSETGLLLSGGRDSRVVAGALHRRGMSARALTLGEARDHDVRCAASVAHVLGFDHMVARDSADGLDEMVRHHVRVEHLASGLANFYTWRMVPLLAALGTRVLSGYRLEDFIGGAARRLPGTDADGSPVERVQRKANAYGIEVDRLRRLLRPDVFGSAVDDCLETIRDEISTAQCDDDRRAWQFDMDHRGRFHSGSTPWRMSLASWPSLPSLDQELIALCASFPMSTLVERRAQDELLRKSFPALASLPLDRNTNNTEPLLANTAWRLRRRIAGRVSLADRAVRQLDRWQGDRRRYYRLYDINSSMWRTVRRAAEDGRGAVADVFDATELASLLPSPEASIELGDPITDSNGLKALLGFMLWWPEYA